MILLGKANTTILSTPRRIISLIRKISHPSVNKKIILLPFASKSCMHSTTTSKNNDNSEGAMNVQVEQTMNSSFSMSSNSSSNSDNQSTTTTTTTQVAFDRRIKLLQRDGAARSQLKYKIASPTDSTSQNSNTHPHDTIDTNNNDVIDYDYFHKEIANRLVDRLDDIIQENGFPLALDIGSGPGFIHNAICSDDDMMGLGGGIGGVLKLVQIDSSSLQLHRDNNDKNKNNNNNHSYENSNGNANTESKSTERCGTYKLVADEEGPLPFPNGTFDLVLSSTSLHWVNNLPGLFQEVKRVLKPDGCFIFAMVGGTTLFELRSSLVLAEMERDGGVSTHIGPFVDVSDVGSLLSNAGFNLTTIDVDTIQFSFPNSMVLMEHLQRMGEGNACMNRRNTVSPSTFLASACIYDEMFRLNEQNGDSQNTEQEIEASVQVIYAIGWTPHESQPKPKERGSATHKLGEVTIH